MVSVNYNTWLVFWDILLVEFKRSSYPSFLTFPFSFKGEGDNEGEVDK